MIEEYIAFLSRAHDGIHKYKVEVCLFMSEPNEDVSKWVDIAKLKFGNINYQDYTQHHNRERKMRYINRHAPREDWEDLSTKGFWSRWLLWNQPTIEDSIDDINNRFNIRIFQVPKNKKNI